MTGIGGKINEWQGIAAVVTVLGSIGAAAWSFQVKHETSLQTLNEVKRSVESIETESRGVAMDIEGCKRDIDWLKQSMQDVTVDLRELRDSHRRTPVGLSAQQD